MLTKVGAVMRNFLFYDGQLIDFTLTTVSKGRIGKLLFSSKVQNVRNSFDEFSQDRTIDAEFISYFCFILPVIFVLILFLIYSVLCSASVSLLHFFPYPFSVHIGGPTCRTEPDRQFIDC